MSTRISTLNVCLGLKNKKSLIKNILEEKKIDVLGMQEIKINSTIDLKELESSGFNLEIENNSEKSRVGFYISKRISYKRKSDLEGIDSNLVIIDIEANRPLRLIRPKLTIRMNLTNKSCISVVDVYDMF